MGQWKEILMEKEDEQADQKLADRLGITYDELMQLGHSIQTEESDDGLIYNYIVIFADNAPREILSKVKGIDNNDMVWLSSWEFENDFYYEEEYEAILSNKDYFQSFKKDIFYAEQLNSLELDEIELYGVLKRQIYISIIGAIETLLAGIFINLIDENEEYFSAFIESSSSLKKQKNRLNDDPIEQIKFKRTVKEKILNKNFHHLSNVCEMYSSTFKVDFPDITDLSKCITTRHNLVHRNGKTKEGIPVNIDKFQISELINKANQFANDIAQNLQFKITFN